jgi:hypothetical protein
MVRKEQPESKTRMGSEVSPEEIELKIRAKIANPNIGKVVSVRLKDGPSSFIFGTLFQIINPSNGAHHHWSLRIDSCSVSQKDGWIHKPTKSARIDGDSSLDSLANTIKVALAGDLDDVSGKYQLVPTSQIHNLRGLLRFAGQVNGAQRIQFVQAMLEQLDEKTIDASEWLKVFEAGADGVRQTIAVTARLAEYKRVRDQLNELIQANVKERFLQPLLAANPWLFGSEYSELLERRAWSRDDRQDFMLRRTTDDYLEIIEIKTPFPEPILKYDSSHDSFAPTSELSLALGQVIRYIEEIDRDRNSIIAKDNLDSLKIRARLIIGRDGTLEMMAALRSLNGHLHRIEILTFDQLLRIADRVLSMFTESLSKEDEDIPF